MVVDVEYVNKKNCFTKSVPNFSFTLGLHDEAITRHRLLQAHITVASEIYTVSQKTSHLWLAITLMHMNGFRYFLAEILPIKSGP